MNEFRTICMIGSMQFYDIMISEEIRLTDLGYIVLHPVKCMYDIIPSSLMKQYDAEIRAKIDMADIVYVIDKHDYVGKSTKSEIEYSISKGKIIYRYSDTFNEICNITDELIKKCNEKESATVALIGSPRFTNLFRSTAKILSMLCFIVYTPSILNFHVHEIINMQEYQSKALNVLDFRIIKQANYVLCVDGYGSEDKYIGEEAEESLKFAIQTKPRIYYTSDRGLTKLVNDQIEYVTHDSDGRK